MKGRLSDRLNAMAAQIALGETVADIGTDHGFLPLYLVEQGISPKAVLSDISRDSLDKAVGNCRGSSVFPKLAFRLGDGLSVLAPGEVDVVVIAGMGGILMAEMLEAEPALSRSFHRYVLQPRNNMGILRYRLAAAGFRIDREILVRERKKICEILVTSPDGFLENDVPAPYGQSPERYEFPDRLLSCEKPLLCEYLESARSKYQRNFTHMQKGKAVSEEALCNARAMLRRIDQMLGEVKG